MPRDYVDAVKGYKVIGSVHMQAGRAPDEQVAETEWLETMHRQFGLPSVAVGHVSFIQPDCAAILEGHARSPLMRGIRSRPTTSPGPKMSVAGAPGTMQDDKLAAELRAPREARHVLGHAHSLLAPGRRAPEVARSFPGIPMVVNHTGLPLDRSEEGLASLGAAGRAALADCPERGQDFGTSALAHGRWDIPSNVRVVREAAAIFGPDRIIFASNLPVASLSTTFGGIVDVMREALIEEPPETLDKFFARNAIRFYRMPIQSP